MSTSPNPYTPQVAQSHARAPVVKHLDFYYVFTTFDGRDLPRFAAFPDFCPVFWIVCTRLVRCAKRGKMRQIAPLREGFLI